MAFLAIKNISLVGLSAAVPSTKDCISKIYKWGDAESFIASTGIKERRRSNRCQTSSDLCIAASEKLIEELKWDKTEIDVLIFVSQTPDYLLPSTSCIIQEKLRLPSTCMTLDISLGCSGWVYALSVISALMQNGTLRKGLLLAGDTITKICSPDDKGTFPLFGDAGTATALEYKEGNPGLKFIFNSNGKGYRTIISENSGFRKQECEPNEENEIKEDSELTKSYLFLDGMDVFSFGITKAPKSIKDLCSYYGIDLEEIDILTLHQANKMMNEAIRKKLKLQIEKVPYSLEWFGNTSCASIPLTLVTQKAESLKTNKNSHIACGFGVGLSWASVWFETDKIIMPGLIEI